MQIYRKASLRAGGASHSSRTFGESLEVMISPSRLVSFATPSFPSFAYWSGHSRIAWLLPRASPLSPTYAPSHARYAISCNLMYTLTPMVLQQMSPHSQHQSTARIRVPSGPFGLAEQGLLFEHFFIFQIFRQGGNAWNLFDFDNQSAAIFC